MLHQTITDGPTIVFINLMFRDISEINDKEMVSSNILLKPTMNVIEYCKGVSNRRSWCDTLHLFSLIKRCADPPLYFAPFNSTFMSVVFSLQSEVGYVYYFTSIAAGRVSAKLSAAQS